MIRMEWPGLGGVRVVDVRDMLEIGQPGGGISAIEVRDDGAPAGNATALDFTSDGTGSFEITVVDGVAAIAVNAEGGDSANALTDRNGVLYTQSGDVIVQGVS